ncbi:hypothetical protein Tco_1251343 [Tanacetum coccineum]
MTKVIKGEFENLGFLKINDDLFACNTQVGTLCDEFNRLSRIDNDLFTYETEIYAEAVIFINKRLVKLIDVTVEQWLDLKYGNHMTIDENIKKGMISTWLIRSYKLQFEEYLEIMKQRDTYACDTKNALWIYWARGDDEVELSDEESSDPDNENLIDEDDVAEIFRIDTNMSLLKILMDLKLTKNIRMSGYMSGMKKYHGYMKNHRQKMEYGSNPLLLNIVASHSYSRVDILEWPTCSWKDDGYCNALEDGKLKEEALLNKAIMDGTINEEEESLDETWKKWDEYENTTHDHEESDVYNEEEHEERRKDTAHNAPV